MRRVVLPQALRNVIPAIVGQFISLFKDTSLLAIVGFFEILEVARSVPSQPAFVGQGLASITLAFAGFLYWVGSYTMSQRESPPGGSAGGGSSMTDDGPTDADLTRDAVVAGGTGEPMITCEGVEKWFGDFAALKGIDLVVGVQEVVVVIGPSGSGKSTLIRCINRLEEHDRGTIVVDGTELTGDIGGVQAVRRRWGWCSRASTCSRT